MRLLLLLLALPLFSVAQVNLTIPYADRSPLIDGHIDSAWASATEVFIPGNTDSISVLLFHNCNSLFVAFRGNMDNGFLTVFPELMFDPNLDQSTDWMSDDWWLHVSATDCESQGVHSDYSNCEEVQPDWKAIPNFDQAPPETDTVEIMIPLSKIGLHVGQPFGLALDVTNTFSMWILWPDAALLDNPSTWAEATLSVCSGVSVETPAPTDRFQVSLFPNPVDASSILEIQSTEPLDATIEVLDPLGRRLASQLLTLQSGSNQVSISQLLSGASPGHYFYRLLTSEQVSSGSFFFQAH